MSDEKSNIDIMDEGPFIVNNLETLENSNGQSIGIRKKIALCRCGASNNKPFCDGSHTKIGFSGIREAKISLDKEKEYNGHDISIFYNFAVCYHARECVNNLPSVFDSDSKPWVNPNGSDAESIINVIKKCPSGALSYKIGDEHVRDFDKNVKIRIEKNGPYCISGDIELNVDDVLQPPSKDHYALCRCGASKNKPYCDGSHKIVGSKDGEN